MSDARQEAFADAFTPVRAGRISALVADQIRTLILEGRLQQGDRLPSERELAERFGVSRVTVRDALRILEVAGLIEVRLGASGGAFVTAPSANIVAEGIANMLMTAAVTPDEVVESRLVLELGIVSLAAARATEEDLAELRRICDASAQAFRDGAYDTNLSRQFHARLATAAHNTAVDMIAASFRGPLSLRDVRAREPAQHARERTVREHDAVARALEARDAPRAREAMAEHLVRGTDLGPRAEALLATWTDVL